MWESVFSWTYFPCLSVWQAAILLPFSRMPAFDFSSWYALFFIAFVIINTYIFMSLFLAVVYNNYKKHLKVVPRGACDQCILAVLCKELLAFPWKALRRGNSFLPLVLCKQQAQTHFSYHGVVGTSTVDIELNILWCFQQIRSTLCIILEA